MPDFIRIGETIANLEYLISCKFVSVPTDTLYMNWSYRDEEGKSVTTQLQGQQAREVYEHLKLWCSMSVSESGIRLRPGEEEGSTPSTGGDAITRMREIAERYGIDRSAFWPDIEDSYGNVAQWSYAGGLAYFRSPEQMEKFIAERGLKPIQR